MRWLRFLSCALSAILLASVCLWASINGSISGVVTDLSGAVVSGATVTATNTQTGVKTTLKTDSKGFYNFPALQIGNYTVDVQEQGFKTESRTGLVIDANSAVRADFTLQIGQIIEKVTVASEAAHVETESTQMGEVITARTITAGNSRRRFFHGPGLNNWDMTLAKVTRITESKELELRVEAFNLFNHAQFGNPDGNINSNTFGIISSARDPRIVQLGARFTF